MKIWFFALLAFLLVACAGASAGPSDSAEAEPVAPETPVVLENLGPAPELRNEVWLNTDAPFRLADLRGKVVLLDMWTFG